MDDGQDGGLDSLQEGLTVAAAWMMHRKRLEGFAGGQRRRSRQQRRRATRNSNKFKILEDISEMAAAAKGRNGGSMGR